MDDNLIAEDRSFLGKVAPAPPLSPTELCFSSVRHRSLQGALSSAKLFYERNETIPGPSVAPNFVRM